MTAWKKKFLGVFFLLGFCTGWAAAQTGKRYTISGYVKDSASGEALLNATISIGPNGGTIQSNAYGYFSISLPPGRYTLDATYTGYTAFHKEIDLDRNIEVNPSMKTSAGQMQAVVVTGEKKLRRTNVIALGVQQMDIGQIKKIPAFMGEPDVLKSLLTMPGVTSVGEGAAGFNVRGGNVDENLIIMDEAPVYNSSHLLGFFSVFNPDAVKNVTLYKSVFPAEYGGRTSSVLDIRMKEGNNQKLTVNGGISNVFSRVSVEGPLQKDKSSFIVAARRSYIDILAKPFLKGDNKDNIMYFYDLTAKGNLKVNDKNTVFLSGYFGRDVFAFNNEASFKWGNTTGTFRWNHLFSPKLFLNNSIYYSKYDYSLQFKTKEEDRQEGYDWKSNIKTYGIRSTLTWYAGARHEVKTGINYVYYDFYPGQGIATNDGARNTITLLNRYGTEAAAFGEDTWKITKAFQVQAGLRATSYTYLGNTDVYAFRDTTAGVRKPLEKTEVVTSKSKVARYNYLEPRVSLRFKLAGSTFLKAGFSRSTQFLHLLSNTASPTPVDLYFPSTNNIKPSLTDQYSLGYVTVPRSLPLEFSVEVFYKWMRDQLDYIDNANLQLNQLVEADLLEGKGKAYGAEFEIKKEQGKWQGWLNYTWSRSWRKTDGISNSDWYLSRYDRTHVINLDLVYQMNKKWQFSANFNYGSGTPASFPDIRFDIQDMTIPYNSTGERNTFRLPAYHRLDVAATLTGKQTKKLKQTWVFGIYNIYARQNAYTIYFRQNRDDPSKKEAVRLSILGSLIPSVTWNFKF